MQNPLFQCRLSVTDSSTAKTRCEFKLLPFSGAGCIACQKELGLGSLTSAAEPLTNFMMMLIKPQTFKPVFPSLKWS